MKISDSAICNFCDKDDDLVHFFIECPLVSNFWQSFANWLSRIFKTNYELAYHTIIFGELNDALYKDIINYCIILAKHHIYVEKLKLKIHNISILNFLRLLKDNLEILYQASCISNTIEAFELKWNIIYLEL